MSEIRSSFKVELTSPVNQDAVYLMLYRYDIPYADNGNRIDGAIRQFYGKFSPFQENHPGHVVEWHEYHGFDLTEPFLLFDGPSMLKGGQGIESRRFIEDDPDDFEEDDLIEDAKYEGSSKDGNE